ncbi:MAG: histidine phosphatase family protein [Actinomycetota bacterium]|nr:histidine phosphatase family protein [Actinomycetota bacterium]
MTRILLVRHGESEWNAARRWQGQADPPLTELGRAQAAHGARALGTVDAIVTSDLQRALVTAQVIAHALGIDEPWIDRRLRERDAGEWSGLTREEIHEQWPGYLDEDPVVSIGWPVGVSERRPPGWEPEGPLWARVRASLVDIARAVPDGDVVAVTHGGVIYATEAQLGGSGGRLANLAARWVDVAGEDMALGERLLLVSPEETEAIERDRV